MIKISNESINIQAIDCAVQHIKTFLDQATKEKRADFGEPCAGCIYVKECGFDWFKKISPLIELSNIPIRLSRMAGEAAGQVKSRKET